MKRWQLFLCHCCRLGTSHVSSANLLFDASHVGSIFHAIFLSITIADRVAHEFWISIVCSNPPLKDSERKNVELGQFRRLIWLCDNHLN